MGNKIELPSHIVKLRSRAEEVLAQAPRVGGFWHLDADCRRMAHELQVYQIELELMSEELEANRAGHKKWIEDVKVVQTKFEEVTENLAIMTERPEKTQMEIQCVKATFRFLMHQFKKLAQDE